MKEVGGIQRAKALLEPLCERKRAIRCPHPDHEDRHASATLYPNGWRCHACGAFGDSLDYYCLTEGLSIREALAKLGVSRGVTKPRREPALSPEEQQTLRKLKVALASRDALVQEWGIAKELAAHSEAILVASFTDPSFTSWCRRKEFDPLLIHDLCFATRDAA